MYVVYVYIVPLKFIEYGFGYLITRSPSSPYSIYLSGIIHRRATRDPMEGSEWSCKEHAQEYRKSWRWEYKRLMAGP